MKRNGMQEIRVKQSRMKQKRMWGAVLAAGMAAMLTACGNFAAENDNAGTQDGVVAGSGTEENSGYREDVAVTDLQAAVAEELGENYWPDMDVPTELLEDMFGITEEMYEEISAQTPMISNNVDTLIIVKAKEGNEQQAEEALNAYKEYNTTEALQYPMNMGKVQAAQIKTYGRYVCFVQLGAEVPESEEEGSEDGDAAAIKHCEQENAKALAVIEKMLTK